MNKSSTTNRVSRSAFLRSVALGLPFLAATTLKAADRASASTTETAPDAGNLRAFVELARSDIRTQKALIIAENIDFTETEAVEFWPLHREYDFELNKLFDRRLELIARYAKQYRTMADKDATALAIDVLDLEGRRTDLKKKYFKKFTKVVMPRKAARFFQIENQLNLAQDLQVAASLPLIK